MHRHTDGGGGRIERDRCTDALAGTLTGLAIVFDEGPASALLDNIRVATQALEGRFDGPGPAAG